MSSMISHKIEELREEKRSMRIKTGGMIAQIKKIFTKRGNSEMAFLTLENNFGVTIECVVFPKTYEIYKAVLLKDSIILISGKLEFKDDQPVIIVDSAHRFYN